ncbi:hypothetical protein F383_04717 [Gossypium arboreum]|uniref:Uncharacterized protein n=1 Tax=Gossypium arboreum TaxID=29729 RepID=A0A0B0NP18_GOSAR|nr:hypothetical protein F383_04717 [Gossypium arboreum]
MVQIDNGLGKCSMIIIR